MDLRGRDWIVTQDWGTGEIQHLIDRASELKERFAAGEPHRTQKDPRGSLTQPLRGPPF